MKFLHTMIRVGNLEKSLDFYVNVMGMELLRKNDFPGGRFTLAFVGFPAHPGVTLELTHNWDTESYDLGNGFGHIAIGVEDVYATCAKIKAAGGNVVREAGPMMHGSAVIAFVEDPDGYKIELLEA